MKHLPPPHNSKNTQVSNIHLKGTSPIVSIIIPAYNAENTIERAIDSCLKQTYQDIEIIVVNDGSTDGTFNILKRIAASDERIVVINQPNYGVSAARKNGLLASSSQYISFLDADDYIEQNFIDILYRKAIETECDIVRARVVRKKCNTTKQASFSPDKQINGGNEYFFAVSNNTIDQYLCGAIYKRDLFDLNLFDKIKEFKIGEDALINLTMSKIINKLLITSETSYFYVLSEGSTMAQHMVSRNYQERYTNCLINLLANAPKEWIDQLILGKYCFYIKSFFVPELGFDSYYYAQVREFISRSDKNYKDLLTMCSSKHTKFLTSKFLFRLYSFAYRNTFKLLRQRGFSRNVLS